MTVEEALAKVAELGYLVNNLFQLSNGTWRASLRQEDSWYYEYGDGPAPASALLLALEKAEAGLGHKVEARAIAVFSGRLDLERKPALTGDVNSILAQLGFLKPSAEG